MKTLTLLLFLLPLTTLAQYKGKVIANEPYEVWIQETNRDDSLYWVRWEPWEYYSDYSIRVEKGDTRHVIWIGQCSGDTIGEAYFEGKGRSCKTIYLDGTIYYF